MASKKRQAKNGNGPMVGLVAVGVLGLGALAAYVKFSDANRVPDDLRRVPNLQNSAAANSDQDSKVELITPRRDGTDLELGKHESDVPSGEDPRIFALNHFLRESKIADPKAKAIGIQVKDAVAFVDVTPEFEQSYGSLDEEAMLKGLTATLAQFKEIEKVQFLVEGKPVATLGNVDLSEPIPVRTTRDSDSSAN